MTSDVKILTQSEINKNILAKSVQERPEDDVTGPFGRFSNELHDIYTERREEFFEASRQYNKLIQESLFLNEERSNEHYRENLYCPFLEPFVKGEASTGEVERSIDFTEAIVIRKRTERSVFTVIEKKQIDCSLESWFKRYMTLNKFIWAVRTVVIKNRLEKRLARLKELTQEEIKQFASMKYPVHNKSYEKVFENFI